jgi:predicted PurR-regulated permease PerM
VILKAERKLAIWFWASLTLLFLAGLYLLQEILLPFVLAFAIAYLLDPLVDRIERLGRRPFWRHICTRGNATLFALSLSTFVLVGIISMLVPVVKSQVQDIAATFPRYFGELVALAKPYYAPLLADFNNGDNTQLTDLAGKQVSTALNILDGAFRHLVDSGSVLLSLFSVVIVTPIVTFYLLRDWDKIVAKIDSWLPLGQADLIRGQMHLVNQSLSGFVRGQGLVCISLGVFYAVALSVIGLDFGLTIGLFTGLMSFVPYFGSGLGLLISLVVAIKQFPDWFSIGLVLAAFIVGQVLEGYVLSPRLVGERVGLHAVWIIFALMAGGSLFGFLGILLAVPVAATLGVLFRFLLDRYQSSEFYLGNSAAE